MWYDQRIPLLRGVARAAASHPLTLQVANGAIRAKSEGRADDDGREPPGESPWGGGEVARRVTNPRWGTFGGGVGGVRPKTRGKQRG